MSITKCPGHMRSLKLNFSATVLTLGLKAKVLGELRTRPPFDRCVDRAGQSIFSIGHILVPRGRAPFGQHQESRPLAQPLAMSNTGIPRFTDFPSLCACSESSLTNLIGSGLNLLCLQSHSKTECRWTGPEVVILGADQKERSLWVREWIGQR